MEIYGKDFVVVGCAKDGFDELNRQNGGQVTLQKWLVDVKCPGCRGLFYRSSPGTIVADADWPRNGDIVVGIEIPDIPGSLKSCYMANKSLCHAIHSYYNFFCRMDTIAKWLLSPTIE